MKEKHKKKSNEAQSQRKSINGGGKISAFFSFASLFYIFHNNTRTRSAFRFSFFLQSD